MPSTNTMTTTMAPQHPGSIELLRPAPADCREILTPAALEFVADLEREFRSWRKALLVRRAQRLLEIDSGSLPDFPFSSTALRKQKWTVAPIPKDLLDRRVEITGPTDRKMIINALNSGANVFMADFEDSNAPAWENMVRGQKNLYEAVRRTITFESPEGKPYALGKTIATLMVRPRGLHLSERHVLVDNEPVSASIFDFALFFFHNARELLERGSGPYFYIPKLEHHQEARYWNDVFVKAQHTLDIPRGSIRATVLIETIHAAFEMDEILFELKEHSAGLNCGRWDYIFSCIKAFQQRDEFLFPDRSLLTMSTKFLRSYSQLLIQTCHRRGIHAIGGMAAFIPIKDDPAANKNAMKRVQIDKEREVLDGHDGTWVAHPGLVPLARGIFDTRMQGPHQIHVTRSDLFITAKDLLDIPRAEITTGGLNENVAVTLQYLVSWLSGKGCVPINNLMEDTATAEICRAQLWHWLHHPEARLAGGTRITDSVYRAAVSGELTKIKHVLGKEGFAEDKFALATSLLDSMVLKEPRLDDFLTIRAQEHLQ